MNTQQISKRKFVAQIAVGTAAASALPSTTISADQPAVAPHSSGGNPIAVSTYSF